MKTKFIKYLMCCLFFCSTLNVFANKIPPQPKPADGQPGLPIDDFVFYLIVFGVFLGIYFIKRKSVRQ